MDFKKFWEPLKIRSDPKYNIKSIKESSNCNHGFDAVDRSLKQRPEALALKNPSIWVSRIFNGNSDANWGKHRGFYRAGAVFRNSWEQLTQP